MRRILTFKLLRVAHFISIFLLLIEVHTARGSFPNDTNERTVITGVGRYEGKISSMSLADMLMEQESSYHWRPWHPIRTKLVEDELIVRNCTQDSSSDFPESIFTDDQLRHGAIVLHFIGGIYSFTFLAVVCNDYFLPAVECICEDLNLSQDVAAATFMASATSCPELFVNIMSTFVTKSDLGIGTIVGSAMFNTLGVTAIGGLSAAHPIAIKKWPVTRDCIVYSINISILVAITWDGRIEWWEAMILLMLYVTYFIFMFNNKRIIKFFVRLFKRKTGMGGFNVEKTEEGKDNEAYEIDIPKYTPARVSVLMSMNNGIKNISLEDIPEKEDTDSKDEKIRKSLWRFPTEKPITRKIWFLYTWPLKLVLTCTIPSPKTYRMLYPMTFAMCILWIAANSYFVSWMITTIGSTFGIPDTIMGMTFLAFGGCLPEALSIFIMSRKGQGGMGVSNSLGANSLAILFSLGIPWFIKSLLLKTSGQDGFIEIESGGIDYIILSLIVAVASLYTVLYLKKFYLMKVTGATIFVIYIVFIVVAILMESGVFFDVGLPVC